MTANELIKELQKYDPELPVVYLNRGACDPPCHDHVWSVESTTIESFEPRIGYRSQQAIELSEG